MNGGLRAGRFALVRYAVGDRALHRERFLAHIMEGMLWVTVTPDPDMYVENVDEAADADMAEYKFKPQPDRMPLGMPQGTVVHAFAPPPDMLTCLGWVAEARAVAGVEWRRRRLPALDQGVVPVLAEELQLIAVGGDGAAGVVAPLAGGGSPRGAETPRGAVRGDARTMAAKYDKSETPCHDFRDAVELCKEMVIPGSLVRGPRTVWWVLKFLAGQGTQLQRRARFKPEVYLSSSGPGVAQHEHSYKLLQVWATFNQLGRSNLAVVELLGRELPMIEEKFSERLRSQHGLSEEAHLFLGTSAARGKVCMYPRRREWISGEVRDGATISRERQKAREERQLLRTPTTEADGAKGGGRGSPEK